MGQKKLLLVIILFYSCDLHIPYLFCPITITQDVIHLQVILAHLKGFGAAKLTKMIGQPRIAPTTSSMPQFCSKAVWSA